jgi:small subunit ribosomal protein S1
MKYLKSFNEILNSIGDKSIKFSGKIIELINGGYWVDILGIKCFMPGSLAGLNKLWDFESLVGKTLNVIPISYSDEKNTIIVSHREYLSTLIPEAIGELNKNIKNQLNGIVTGTFKAGVFAEFNQCLTGLIPSTELDEETLERFNKNEIKPGELIQFWTKEIISNKKIILTQKGPNENVWDNIGERYKPSMVVTGTVTKITNYGAFVKLEKGVSGLIHKSKLKNILLNKGDLVNVRIQSIDFSNRKIAMALID